MTDGEYLVAGGALMEVPRWRERQAEADFRAWGNGSDNDAPPDLPTFSAADLAGEDAPVREWLVDLLIPAGTVTTLGGDGRTGKGLLALQLAASVALGRRWIGHEVVPGPAWFLTAEDGRGEVHRRLTKVAGSLDAELADLGRLTLLVLAGEDALFAMPPPGSHVLAPTRLFAAVDRWVGAHRPPPRLVVLDTLADFFGGAENERARSSIHHLAPRRGDPAPEDGAAAPAPVPHRPHERLRQLGIDGLAQLRPLAAVFEADRQRRLRAGPRIIEMSALSHPQVKA